LPEVTHPKLRRGIAGIAAVAAEQRGRHAELVAERAPGTARASVTAGPDDGALYQAIGNWIDRTWSPSGSGWAQIERTARFFAADDRADRVVVDEQDADLSWFELALDPAALAFIALAIGTPADKRGLAVDLVRQLAKLPDPTQLRSYTFRRDETPASFPRFILRWQSGNAYAHRRLGYAGDWTRVLEYAPGGTFRLPGEGVLSDELRGVASFDPAEIEPLAAAVAAGKTSWSPEAAARLATLTGLTPSEASFLWAGCPGASTHAANFLPKELRETLGLKVAQAVIARDGLHAIPLRKKRPAIAEAARAGVAALLDGSAVDRLADGWQRFVGKRIAVPEEVVEAASDLQTPIEASAGLAMIAGGKDSAELVTDGIWALDPMGEVIRASKPEPFVGQTALPDLAPVFGSRELATTLVLIPFLYAELPVGHPLRAAAAVAYDLVLDRLRNPALWLASGSGYLEGAPATAFDRSLEGLGGTQVAAPENLRVLRFPGLAVVRFAQYAKLQVHPASLDKKARGLVDKIAAPLAPWGQYALSLLDYAHSDDLLAIVARIAKTPVPEGGWEQNPLASAPKLVDKVAKHAKLSRDAAALYLQYLVLLWPTPRAIQAWNGWSAKQFGAANGELLDAELVIEAKRERAQRSVFLPGGWEAFKSPHAPMESWKFSLYGTRTPSGEPRPRFHTTYQAVAPFHQLFERAWQRVEGGDPPRYEEVKKR
jgi:hypothetical protein